MCENNDLPVDKGPNQDGFVHARILDEVAVVDERVACFREKRTDPGPDNHAASEKGRIFSRWHGEQGSVHECHGNREDHQIERNPEWPEEASAIALDYFNPCEAERQGRSAQWFLDKGSDQCGHMAQEIGAKPDMTVSTGIRKLQALVARGPSPAIQADARWGAHLRVTTSWH
jgi:hypothetical protein